MQKQHKHFLFALISAVLSPGALSFLATSNIASTRIYVKNSADPVPSQRLYCGIEKCLVSPASIRSGKQSSRLEMLFGNNKKKKVEMLKTVCRLIQQVHSY
jgi:hypothetical protein